MDMQACGTTIREYRKKAKISQQQPAAELKMSRATIFQIEIGATTEIDVRKLSQIRTRPGPEINVAPRLRAPLPPDALRIYSAQRMSALNLYTEILTGKSSFQKTASKKADAKPSP
jgi:DNA-binding XRE family transcriptional regulator